MSNIEILMLSVALAIDAMLVSFSYGLIIEKKKYLNAFLLAFSFGLFQFIMPMFGYFLSSLFYEKLISFSNWIVFFIFIFLGLKFLKEAFEKKEEKVEVVCISFWCLFCLAIATSIDALGAGVSFRLLNINWFFPSVVIGIVTFVLSAVGFFIANIFKKLPSRPVEVFGAALLIYLAIKAILF